MRGCGLVVVATIGAVIGCGGSSPSMPDGALPADAAIDAPAPDGQIDAPTDAPIDAPIDVMIDAAIDAPPVTYKIGGRVTNLLGSGLVLALDGGTTLTINQDGTFTFSDLRATGTMYAVTIQTPSSNPPQHCTITGGMGLIGTADVTDVEVSCSLGGLRINEISACYYTDVPCWFEVVNTGPLIEQLADYQLRGTAAESGATFPSHSFDLPALIIPPGGYAIVRGRPFPELTGGQNLVHVADPINNRVPYWSGGGFLELLRSSRTVDFVRMGSDPTAPTTTGWTGAGAPQIIQTNVYGAVIARTATSTDTDTAGDWSRRAFATPGGPNDITSDVDMDSDGIPDQAEVAGGTFAGLDLYARGVRTAQRDILIEIDYMPHATDAGVKPMRAALDQLLAVFAAHGIVLHWDVGALFSPTPGAANLNFGGGNYVPFAPVVSFFIGEGVPDLYAMKMQHMDVRLHAVSHYVLFASDLDIGTLGIGEIDGNDLIIALGNKGLVTGTPQADLFAQHTQAATLMHEFGHNLGLRHGGSNDKNYKPNYISTMNYLYNVFGGPTIGAAEGDRYYYVRGSSCGLVTSELQLTNNRYTTTFVIDYSDGTSAPLNEAAIVESAGLGRPGSLPVDYNCDGMIGTIALDVDRDGDATSIHTDHDDWDALRLPFARTVSGASFAAGPRLSPFTDERRPVADETGFHLGTALP